MIPRSETGDTVADGFDAAEAFAMLGDETRVAIIRALAGQTSEPLSFADLRERAGVDDSGRFNYHLGKLVGTFVEKTDEGYTLTYAGSRVVGAIYEGTYAPGDPLDPIELDGACVDCGGVLALDYDEERMTISCRDCEEVVSDFGFPPGALEGRPPATLPSLLTRHLMTLVQRARAGLCANCSGILETTCSLQDDDDGHAVLVEFRCARCQQRIRTSLESVLLSDSAVVSFYYDHGLDIQESVPWSLPWVRDTRSEQVETSPQRYAVWFTFDGETLRVEVDESLAVVDATRTPSA